MKRQGRSREGVRLTVWTALCAIMILTLPWGSSGSTSAEAPCGESGPTCRSRDLSVLEWCASNNEDRNPNPIDNFAEIIHGTDSCGEYWGMAWNSPALPDLTIGAVNHCVTYGATALLIEISASEPMEVGVWIRVSTIRDGRDYVRYVALESPILVAETPRQYVFSESDFVLDPTRGTAVSLGPEALEMVSAVILFPDVRSGQLKIHSLGFDAAWLQDMAATQPDKSWVDDINVPVGQSNAPLLLDLNPTVMGWANNYSPGFQCGLIGWAKHHGMHFVSSISFWEDNTTTSVQDLSPELRNATCVDIDGTVLTKDDGLIWMNTNSPSWQDAIRSFAFAEVDRGVDGFVLDEFTGNGNAIWHGGTFDEESTAGFRDYLDSKYSDEHLRLEYGIESITAFDYREYLLSRGFREVYLESPWQCPLFGDFQLYQYAAAFRFARGLVGEIRQHAAERGGAVTISANAYEMGTGYLWTAAICDYLTFEHQYLWPQRVAVDEATQLPAQWKAGPELKLAEAITDHRPIVMPSIPDLVMLGDCERDVAQEFLSLFIAEAYAAGGSFLHFNIDAFEADSTKIAPVYSMFRTRSDALAQSRSLARVAVIYSLPSAMRDEGIGFRGACMLLSDLLVQYDVLFAGFGDQISDSEDSYCLLDSDITLSELEQYEKIILPGSNALTDRQVSLLIQYMNYGGHLVTWDSFGLPPAVFDALDRSADRPEFEELLVSGSHEVGDGMLTYFARQDLGTQYYSHPSAEQRDVLAGHLFLDFEPIIAIEDSEGLNAYASLSEDGQAMAVCLLNETVDTERGGISHRKSLAMSVRLPEGIEADRVNVTYTTPESPEESVPIETSVQGNRVFFVVPELAVTGLLVVGQR